MVTALDAMYPVQRWPALSAYNGAALYPIREIQRTGARYDAGVDGQRCEHVGFHLALTGRDGEGVVRSGRYPESLTPASS